MSEAINTAYDVSGQLFGPESGIPWWAWVFVVVALFWKLAVPEQKTARLTAEERDEQMLTELFGTQDGKKGKKAKKAKK
jgi:hypothetical protein